MHAQRCPVAKLRAATQENEARLIQAAHSKTHTAKKSLLPSLIPGGGQSKKKHQGRDRQGLQQQQQQQQAIIKQERPLSFFQNIHGDAAPSLPPRPQMYGDDDSWTPARPQVSSRVAKPPRSKSTTHAVAPNHVMQATTHTPPLPILPPKPVTHTLSPTHTLTPTHTLSPTHNLTPTHTLSPTHTAPSTSAPLPRRVLPPIRAPPPTHNSPHSRTLLLTHQPPSTSVLSPTCVKGPMTATLDGYYNDAATKLLRRRPGEEPLIYNEHCAVHGHTPAPETLRLPSIPKSPSFPSVRQNTSGERLKNWRRNSLTFPSQGNHDLVSTGSARDLESRGSTSDPLKTTPAPLLSPSRIQRSRQHQQRRTLSAGSGLGTTATSTNTVKGGTIVSDNPSRRSHFRRALSMFLIGCDDETKEKQPQRSILRQPTRHTYRRGISGLPIECTNRHVGVAY